MQALAVLLGLFLVTFAGFAIFNDNPLGGEPIARVAMRQTAAGGRKARHDAASEHGRASGEIRAKQAAPADQKTVTIIDGSSGARHDVAIGGDDAPDKAEAEPPPAMMAGIDPRLLEKSRYGMIPVVVGRAEALHRLCRRSRPRQGRENAHRRHRGRRPRRRRGQDHRRHHEAAARGDAGVHALRLGSRPSWPNARARSATKSCCRFRWSRSTIPTTTPARRPC